MELTSLKNAADGRILKMDTGMTKNYLEEREIKQLERTLLILIISEILLNAETPLQ